MNPHAAIAPPSVRQAMLDAGAQLLPDRGEKLTIEEIAARAGVATADARQAFPTTDELFVALVEWLKGHVETRGYLEEPKRPDDIARIVRNKYRVMADVTPIVTTLAQIPASQPACAAQTAQDSDAIADALAELTSQLPAGLSTATRVMINNLAAPTNWMRVCEKTPVPAEEWGLAVSWAIDTLVNALRDGHGPSEAVLPASIA